MQYPYEIAGQTGQAVAQNRVLRNTYALLGLSMLPTVLGAFVGVKLGFSFFADSPVISFVLFLALAFGFMWGIARNKDSGLGVALLLGFTFFMGLMLSRILGFALGLSNGATLIALAGGGTGAVFFTLAGIATATKKDFSGLSKFLFVGLVVLLLASLANVFFQVPALALTISAAAVMLFSAFILVDVSRVVTGGETNYIMATLAIYLDIYNLFVSLLNLLMFFAGEKD